MLKIVQIVNFGKNDAVSVAKYKILSKPDSVGNESLNETVKIF